MEKERKKFSISAIIFPRKRPEEGSDKSDIFAGKDYIGASPSDLAQAISDIRNELGGGGAGTGGDGSSSGGGGGSGGSSLSERLTAIEQRLSSGASGSCNDDGTVTITF